MYNASYGQACMHDLQPMHRLGSKSTIPSGRVYSATVGQMLTQGALSQWLHRRTAKYRRELGNSPFSTYLTQVRNAPSGTSFSILQATVQAWQPMHFRWSRTKPYFNWSPLIAAQTEGSYVRRRSASSGP